MVMVPKQRLFIIGRNYTTQVLSRQQLISCHCERSEAIHCIKKRDSFDGTTPSRNDIKDKCIMRKFC